MHEYLYKVTSDCKATLLEYNRPANEVIFLKIISDKEGKSISFDFDDHIIELIPNDTKRTIFVKICVIKSAIGVMINTDFEGSEFMEINEGNKCRTGVLYPEYYLKLPINDQDSIIIDYGRFTFTIKDTIINYYAFPVTTEEEGYYYRLSNNSAMNHGAVLIQRGGKGFSHNSLTMFLNTITFQEIGSKNPIIENLKKNPDFTELLTRMKEEYQEFVADNPEMFREEEGEDNESSDLPLNFFPEIHLLNEQKIESLKITSEQDIEGVGEGEGVKREAEEDNNSERRKIKRSYVPNFDDFDFFQGLDSLFRYFDYFIIITVSIIFVLAFFSQ